MIPELKNFIIYEKQKAEEGGKPREIEITESQAKAILSRWKTSPNAELFRSDGSLLDVVNRSEWRIRSSDKKPEDKADRVWVCDYGGRHPMSQGIYTDFQGKKAWKADCECKKIYGDLIPFRDWITKTYGIGYPSDITEAMQKMWQSIRSGDDGRYGN